MKLTKIFYDGLISIADAVVDPRTHSYPRSSGFQRDQRQLSGDVRKVGSDMKKAIDKYGRKQPYEHSSSK